MKNATACPFLGGGMPGLLSIEGKSSKAQLKRVSQHFLYVKFTDKASTALQMPCSGDIGGGEGGGGGGRGQKPSSYRIILRAEV